MLDSGQNASQNGQQQGTSDDLASPFAKHQAATAHRGDETAAVAPLPPCQQCCWEPPVMTQVDGYPTAVIIKDLGPLPHGFALPPVAFPCNDTGPAGACECSLGWLLFLAGWFFPAVWLLGACLPLCGCGSRGDRHAAIASGIMLAVCIGMVVTLVVLLPPSRAPSYSCTSLGACSG